MESIYDFARKDIENGGFNLAEKLRELTIIMLMKQISIEEYGELTELAAKYADSGDEPAETGILGAMRAINTQIAAINDRLTALEEATGQQSPVEDYPEWERWNGQTNSGYKFGDKVTHLGVKYVSNYVGLNVWEPGLQGTESLWTVVG